MRYAVCSQDLRFEHCQPPALALSFLARHIPGAMTSREGWRALNALQKNLILSFWIVDAQCY